MTSCGAVDANDLRARVAAKDCAVAAIVAHRPFVYELAGGGIDSEVARAWIGVVERGRLVTYVASFDRDPCGLGCPEDGGTVIERCRELQPDDQDGSFACTGSESVASCSFGK